MRQDIDKIQTLAKKYGFEIIAVCRKCGEHWTTLEEWKYIKDCETCNTDEFLDHYVTIDDVIEICNKAVPK